MRESDYRNHPRLNYIPISYREVKAARLSSAYEKSFGDTLVSLRNFHRVVRVAPDGSVRRSWGPINYVHEPSLLPDGSLLVSDDTSGAIYRITFKK